MGLRDLLKKKDQLDDGAGTNAETLDRLRAGPEFTFIRSDTHTQEIIHPPSHYGDSSSSNHLKTKDGGSSSGKPRRSLDVFRSSRSRASSTSSAKSDYLGAAPKEGSGGHRRLSQRLGLSSRGGKNATSEYVPGDLPQISITGDGDADTQQGDGDGDDGGRGEREWEKRATMLAQAADESERRRSRSPAAPELAGLSLGGDDAAAPRRRSNSGVVSSKTLDEDIQEAIRLHEEGELEKSTSLFGRLADPQGANNPLSQVLYGLALRHGWGCEPDPARAVSYLSAAASNAAEVERMALQAGLNKGGAAKGELILAIFELANCFRNGWGVDRDPVAAKQYYETAANLGDTGEYFEPDGLLA
ncbi:hypothetical protein MGN70_014206 [Eutypa lata]|uniref:Putative cell cycle inhibitor nif1 protein n=1 Tax=Eutypa lata (strain UCR-EL1) TaxID=1287681 RepID=M7SYP7_EUTLA|nr:putative cell cycle inhibitor nif1 protein [Eutypa lata UCREL1]KAI1244335.1 hypothetical protein MGN70_014206 [Eutypa lata]